MNFSVTFIGFVGLIVVTVATVARHQATEVNYDQVRQHRQWQPHPELPKFQFNPAPVDAYLLKLSSTWQEQWQQPKNRSRMVEGLARSFPASTTKKDLIRIQFLVEKTLPSMEGAEFAELAIAYFQYKQAHDELSRQSLTRAERYQQTLALQQQYFSAEHFSEKQRQILFQRSNQLTRYLLQRQQIQQQTDLSEQEKQSALKTLHQQFLEQSQSASETSAPNQGTQP